MTLWRAEMRRALHRRAVRVLIGSALLACVAAGVIAFVSSSGATATELRLEDEGHPAVMAQWWVADEADGVLALGMFFLVVGAFFGGATVAGAEWRAGTVTAVLTWEPRRVRLHAARAASAAVLAFVVSLVLQAVFLAAFLPAVFVNGTTAGTDGSFWLALVLVIARTSVITSVAAVLALSLATVGRNTAFAVITMFAWVVVVEGLIRGLRPSLSRWLWAENLAIVMTWSPLDDVDVARGPALAAATLLVYVGAVVGLAAVAFARRDVVGAT